MRSLFVLGAFALLTGCARLPGSGSDREVEVTVGTNVDSTLRVAATQLQHHGYTVTAVGNSQLVTAPRPVPDYLIGQSSDLRGRQWFVQVVADRSPFTRGTRLNVSAFLVPPPPAGAQASTTPQVQNAVQVTSASPLWQEVRSISTWIRDGTRTVR